MSGVLIDWALQPLTWVVLLWTASLAVGASGPATPGRTRTRKRARAGLVLGLTGLLLLWTAATPLAANAALGLLEISRTGSDACTGTDAATDASPIVVPGADMDAWSSTSDPWRVLGPDTLARTLAAAGLLRASPHATVHVLGGGDNGRSLGSLMQRVLVQRGIAPGRIVAETRSRSTRGNARALTSVLPPERLGAPVRLLTSALHLARATRTFERVGYRVCGTGVDSLRSASTGLPAVLPWLASLGRTSAAVREALASALYAWRAR